MAPRRGRQYEASFSRFPLLPQELQNMIWQTAIDCVKPRIVEVHETTARETRESKHLQKRQFTSPCPIPGVLHACSASRQLALRRWKLSFASRCQHPKIFFDFSNDTLYFDGVFADMSTFVKRVDRGDRDAVQYLAIAALLEYERGYFHDGYDLCIALREDFPAVSNIRFPWVDRKYPDPADPQLLEVRLQQRLHPRKGITMWKKANPERDWDFEADTACEIKECCDENEWSYPDMKLVDSCYTDLCELEYDEDDRNFQRWHVEKLWKEMCLPVQQ